MALLIPKEEPTFHPFSRLPPELRLRIWSLNLPTSRLIPMNSFTGTGTPSTQLRAGCTSSAAIPSNLHTVSESRSHALRTRYTPALAFARSQPNLLIDFEADILYFPRIDGYMASSSNFYTALTLCDEEELSCVRRLAVHEDVFESGCGDDLYFSSVAVGKTVEVLGRIRERLDGVDECVFLSRTGQGRAERLRDQVRTAMADLGWEGLQWSVMEEP